MIINIILSIVVIAAIGTGVYFYYKKLTTLDWNDDYENTYNLTYLTQSIIEIFANVQKQNLKEMNMSKKQLEQKEFLKNQLRQDLRTAAHGDRQAKKFVTDYIEKLLKTQPKVRLNELDVNKVIHFDEPDLLKNREKFEITMYIYMQKYDRKAFTELVNEYGIDKPLINEDGGYYYDLNEEKLNEIYFNTIEDYEITYNDKVKIIANRIFADYKGAGAAQYLLDCSLDEIDCGVSGIPKDSYDIQSGDSLKSALRDAAYSYESIWVMVHGINIRLSCLSFGTQDELVRVCQNIYKFNAPYSLSRKTGYVVATMKDGSRIVVVRPPFAESWGFFLRKFDSVESQAPGALFRDEGNLIPLTLMKWFIRGYRTIGITGGMGSGKSTTLKSFIRYIPEDLNLRVQEKSFELNLRFPYPRRNIFTLQETESITGQNGLDASKKMNGSVTIIGEVAEAAQATWMIQSAMVASLYTLFTHHAKTASDLVLAIRNNLLESGGYTNEKAAEEMVAKVINFDFHMEKLRDHRYCSRITEIIPIRDRRYPSEKGDNVNLSNEDKLKIDTIEYQKRITDRQVFEVQDICKWVLEETDDGSVKGHYEMVSMPTEETMAQIRQNLSYEDEQLFLKDMAMLESMIGQRA